MAHIVTVTGAHLCRNPRVLKEALTLKRVGYRVTIIAPLFSASLKEVDRDLLEGSDIVRLPYVDLSSKKFGSFLSRANRRLSEEMVRRSGVQSAASLGYSIGRALRLARSLKADYYIGHQEVGAWVVWKLMQQGYRVGADLEDWYSRDLLPEARAARPIKLLDRIERDLVLNARHCVTTSEVMADAMEQAYGRRPGVVYNAFPWAERDKTDGYHKDRHADDRPSLLWFSQTIGPGRGLEMLIDALAYIANPVQLHLRGNLVPGFDQTLRERLHADSAHSIVFHPLVFPGELPSRIAEHDIGLALEPSVPSNKDLTISNKILQYLQGGLAVIASPTAGQKEVAATAGDGIIITQRTPADLAESISSLVGSAERLQRAKRLSLEAAEAVFSWEAQEEVLLREVSSALETPPQS